MYSIPNKRSVMRIVIETICGKWALLRRSGGSRRGPPAAPGGEATAAGDPGAPAGAPAMLMASRDIGPLVRRVADRLEEWQDRRDGRRRLMTLDDRALRDIGISRYDAEQEYRKPFWR